MPLHIYQYSRNPKHWQHQILVRLGATWILIHCWWNANLYSHVGRPFGSTYKTKYILITWFSNHTPQYLPEGVGNIHIQSCTSMFITALFIIPKFGSNQYVLPFQICIFNLLLCVERVLHMPRWSFMLSHSIPPQYF